MLSKTQPKHAAQLPKYLSAEGVRSSKQTLAVEVVYFTCAAGRLSPLFAETLTTVDGDGAYWAREAEKLFKIIDLENYSPELRPFELRERAQALGYERLLRDLDYFGYYYRMQRAPAVGCRHKISGCAYWCAHANGFFVCEQCAQGPIERCNRVKCLFCGQIQPFSGSCRFCKQRFGNYSCQICELNVHQSSLTHPFKHCTYCGVCHPSNYVFCQRCRQCSADEFHKCEKDLQCPVCLQSLRDDAVQNECGHALCYKCYRLKLFEKDVKCPICKRTFLLSEDFAYMRDALRADNFNYDCDDVVLRCECNDCGSAFVQRAQRWQYCRSCDFFNVDVLQASGGEEDAACTFDPTIAGMRRFLLENYREGVLHSLSLRDGNDMQVLSRIYEFLGVTADQQTARLMSRVARFGIGLRELKVRLKTQFRVGRRQKFTPGRLTGKSASH